MFLIESNVEDIDEINRWDTSLEECFSHFSIFIYIHSKHCSIWSMTKRLKVRRLDSDSPPSTICPPFVDVNGTWNRGSLIIRKGNHTSSIAISSRFPLLHSKSNSILLLWNWTSTILLFIGSLYVRTCYFDKELVTFHRFYYESYSFSDGCKAFRHLSKIFLTHISVNNNDSFSCRYCILVLVV